MRVLKFGGTSVGTAERLKSLVPIIKQNERAVIVLSAFSGVTNHLEDLSACVAKKNKPEFLFVLNTLENRFISLAKDLFSTEELIERASIFIQNKLTLLTELYFSGYSLEAHNNILAQGELVSTYFFQSYLEEIKEDSALLNALDFMVTSANHEPDLNVISKRLNACLKEHLTKRFLIVQGFICRDHTGAISNLKRGGSDYSATLIGAALKAKEIQIWTDIDGMHNNDPRLVEHTEPIKYLSFDEASELAYFGAKILHPTCVIPAVKHNIPIYLKNTLEPEAHGTLIGSQTIDRAVKAIAAKDGITAIKIKSDRMLQAHGFLKKVFEVFETHCTSIDMITTSEVGISLTIDNDSKLPEIIEELHKLGTIEVDKNQTIVCIVGDFIGERKGLANLIFKSLVDIPIRMISYGGSRHNISLLINSENKSKALNSIHQELFQYA